MALRNFILIRRRCQQSCAGNSDEVGKFARPLACGHRIARNRRQHGEHGGAMQKTCERDSSPLQLTRRITRTEIRKGQTDYDDAIVRAFHGSGEHPFFYDTVWDVMRLVDYLETRADVDTNRIGLTGIFQGRNRNLFHGGGGQTHRRRRSVHRRAKF